MKALLAAAVAAGILALGVAGCGSNTPPGEPQPADAPREFFGVVPQSLLTEEDLNRMQEGRVGTIRLVIPWGALAPEEKDAKQVDYSSIDPILVSAAENGVRVVPTIYGTPTWVAEGLDGYTCDPGCGPYAPTSDEVLAAWKDFVDQLVERYGPDGDLWTAHPELDRVPVRSWQIWNEQNSPTFYQPEVDPAPYERLLDTASEAIKDRDPDAEVILGGMFGTPFNGKPPALSAPRDAAVLHAGGRQIRARLVVGADGAQSRVRELAGLVATRTDYGQTAIVAMVSLSSSTQHRGTSACTRFRTSPISATASRRPSSR